MSRPAGSSLDNMVPNCVERFAPGYMGYAFSLTKASEPLRRFLAVPWLPPSPCTMLSCSDRPDLGTVFSAEGYNVVGFRRGYLR
jgi:hypothetical protein